MASPIKIPKTNILLLIKIPKNIKKKNHLRGKIDLIGDQDLDHPENPDHIRGLRRGQSPNPEGPNPSLKQKSQRPNSPKLSRLLMQCRVWGTPNKDMEQWGMELR